MSPSPRRRPRSPSSPSLPSSVADTVSEASTVLFSSGAPVPGAITSALPALVAAAAARLRALRLAPGSRVAVWRVPAAAALALTFAAPAERVVLVWCNDRWRAAEAARVLRDARADAVLTGGLGDARLVVEALAAAAAGAAREVREPVVLAVAAAPAGSSSEELAEWQRLDDPPRADGGGVPGGVEWPRSSADAPLPYAIFYTSGTTGEPKGVVLSHRAMLCQAQAKLEHVGYDSDTRYLHLAPLFHLGGASSAVAVALAGGMHILPGPGETSPIAWLAAIERCRVNTLVVVPSVLQMLVDAHDRAVAAATAGSDAKRPPKSAPGRSVRTILYGGGACSRGLRADTTSRGFPNCRRLVGAYGMTEAASSMTFVDHSRLPTRSIRHASVGRSSRHVSVAVRRKPDSFRTQAGGYLVGEIVTCGPHVMDGYFGRPAATRATVSTDGWLSTGDMGYIDDDGYLFVVGRIKDMIKTGGENVFAGEVEAVLGRHPAVISSAVIGVPHRVLGEAVCAAVITATGGNIDIPAGDAELELTSWCRARLSPFKCPKWILPMERFPSNTTGKVLKHELRDEVQRLLLDLGGSRLVPLAKL